MQMKTANKTLKVAGKESDNLRYLVLEPPMQRRRKSPYKLNHNILKTDTINYINGSDNGSDETSDRMPSPPANGEANGEKEMDQTKRRLEYEGSPVKRAAGKRSEDSLVQLRRDEDVTPKRVMKENKEPQPSAKRFSPAKEQRKKDLIGMKNKQNERVTFLSLWYNICANVLLTLYLLVTCFYTFNLGLPCLLCYSASFALSGRKFCSMCVTVRGLKTV